MIALASVSTRVGSSGSWLGRPRIVDDETLAHGTDVAESLGHERGEAHAPSSHASIAPPQRIGRYILLENVGAGGMGLVYNAYDPKLNRRVAIKVLRETSQPGSPRHATSRARLVREAQSLAMLTHPNVVTVHDVDTADGKLYMAMEYVEGRSVAEWLRLERPPWREILRVFLDAGRGLVAAHEQGITHRDFKPTNVLIGDDGRVRVLDFGLAKHRGDASSDEIEPFTPPSELEVASADIMNVVGSTASLKLTLAGRIVGTPTYMAPEQYRASGDVGPPTDQFAFAVSLYESLYGTLPFRGVDRNKRQEAAAAGRIEEPPKDSNVPTWIYRVLVRALAPEPADRYPSMAAMLAELANDPARRRRRAATIAFVALAGTLGAVGTALAIHDGQRERPCRGAQGQWDEMWTSAQRHAVSQALKDTGVSYADDTANRVVAAIDDYGERWVDQRTRVCEATQVHREQSESLLDARMGCLDERRNEMAALVRVLSESDDRVVPQAVGAVYGLRHPSTCASWQPSVADALPEAPRMRAEIASIRLLLDEAYALMLAGRYLRAVEVAERARQRAEVAGHEPTYARARLYEGRALRFAEQNDEARAVLQDAVMLAAKVGDITSEATAWSTLVLLAQTSPSESDAWRLAARTAIVRVAGDTTELRLALRLNESAVDMSLNRLDSAEQANREALELGQRIGDGQHPNVVVALRNLGSIEATRRNYDKAEQAFRSSLELRRKLYGPRHPLVADSAYNLGSALVGLGRPKDAEPFLREALEINESVYGKDHAVVLRNQNSLGAVYMAMWDLEHDASLLDEAEKLFRSMRGALGVADDIETRVKVLNNLGIIAYHRKTTNEAIELQSEALNVLTERVARGENRPRLSLLLGDTLTYLCQAGAESAEPRRWLESCDRARTTYLELGDAGREPLRYLEVVREWIESRR